MSVDPADPSSAAPLTAFIHERPFGGGQLVRDYLAEVPAASDFYTGSPFRLESYRVKAAEVASRFDRSDREQIAAALRPTSAAAAERLARFVEVGGLIVTTGQQAGFLTGPLYTVYKALSAVVLARHLESELGVVVLPVFWIASDDHDWAEVNHAFLLDPAGRLRRFELSSRDPRPLPMSERRLSGPLDALCDDVLQYLGGNEVTQRHVKQIVDPYRVAGATVGSAFGHSISAVLSPFDVLLADSADPAVKGRSAAVMRAAVVDSESHESMLVNRSRAMEARGYRSQVSIQPGATNVFFHGSRGRERIHRDGQEYVIRETRERFTRDSLLGALEENPSRFSPNVLLRPVVESAVFPTIAYVGGPAETAYFAQAGVMFEAFGMTPPIVVPRFGATVIEPAISRHLQKLGIPEHELDARREDVVEKLARREIPDEVSGAIARIRRDLVEGFDSLAFEAEAIDPSLFDSIGGIRNRLLLGAAAAERKVLRAIKRREAVDWARVDRVLASLRPTGEPQERVLNLLPFVARYGDGFVRSVERTISDSWRLPTE